MKRILHLIKGLGRGGAEQLLVNAAPYLNRSKFDYEIAYLLPWKDALVGELESAGLSVHCLEGGRGPGWIPRLRRLVRERDVNLIHSHSPLAAAGVRACAGWRRPRRVYTEHNVWERFHPATYWLNLLTLPRCEYIFAVSGQVQASIKYPEVLRFLPRPPTETLHHGPDPAAVEMWGACDGVREELGIPKDAPIVGSVANFKEHKGYSYLIDAAREVSRAIPGTYFVFVGLGPLEEEIKDHARRLGISNKVVFAGYRTDVPRVAAAFDVFALASLHEGLSIALVEAMAMGKPAVVTNVGGLPEVVEHGRQGLVVPPRDPQALAAGIVQLLQDHRMREVMGASARARARHFDIRNAVKRMEEVYEGLLS